MKIQWFPGHIARARREIKDHLYNVDIVIEIIDARCPLSSINFLYDDIKNKKRLIVMNKADLADIVKSKKIVYEYINFQDIDINSIVILDSRNNDIKKLIDKKIDNICNDILKKNESKGIANTLLKAMVVGMPNVGKSTFINSYVKKRINKVENTPGVTKRLQWTKVSDKLLLLDTPGVTMPKFESDEVGFNLALVGSINDDIVEKQDLAYEFIKKIKSEYFNLLVKRYKLKETTSDSEIIDIMNEIAILNGCIKKGNNIDYDKASKMIITDFRKGTLGNITLER